MIATTYQPQLLWYNNNTLLQSSVALAVRVGLLELLRTKSAFVGAGEKL